MPLSTVRVLIVDDYEPLRYLKSILLRRAGAVACEAKCGQEALQMLQTERLDLALLDFNLPDMSAKELSERMRTDPATSGLPVIYTSASDRPTQLDLDDLFFQEPFDTTELIDAIRRLVWSS
jgi:CheY-like chemotaxis protein